MPAAISHYLLARRVLDDRPLTKAGAFSKRLLWGAQGPDFFFTHRFSLGRREKA